MSPLGSGPAICSVAGTAREMPPLGSGPALYSIAGTARELSPARALPGLYRAGGGVVPCCVWAVRCGVVWCGVTASLSEHFVNPIGRTQ
eukprot:gene19846-biopygen2528